ncbi:MAG: hypothetical protein CR977_01165 [Gammaproteobacteria bacterium]|nr:MAG: hypothetical protein CR977_01165 [Gammaproteobacteria bacterium]
MNKYKKNNVAFLILDNFSLMAFSSAIEPMRAVNRLIGESVYDWQLYSLDGQPVSASNGVSISVDGKAADSLWQ